MDNRYSNNWINHNKPVMPERDTGPIVYSRIMIAVTKAKDTTLRNLVWSLPILSSGAIPLVVFVYHTAALNKVTMVRYDG